MAKATAGAKPATKRTAKAKSAPTYEEIALRAYHIYLERGCTPGDPMQDWLQAERELSDKPTAKAKATGKSKVVLIAA